jgi:hypothetical protein
MDLNNAVGFFDASCEKCGKRIGWCGKLKDRPPCPRCGKVVETIVLSADEKRLIDGDAFCKVQTLYFKDQPRFSQSEQVFIRKMYRMGKDHEAYSAVQRASIDRLYKTFNKEVSHG